MQLIKNFGLNRFYICFFFYFLFSFSLLSASSENPNLLFKIYTRNNPQQFLNTLDKFYSNLSGQTNTHFLIACESFDPKMNTPEMRASLSNYPNLTIVFNDGFSETQGCNNDIASFANWFDILVLASDHIPPAIPGYDKTIVNEMKNCFPDFDGVLNFNDGTNNQKINTVPVIGKKYYALFGYAFNTTYHLLGFAKSELTSVSRIIGKEFIRHQAIFSNEPSKTIKSHLNEMYSKCDEIIFKKRSIQSFDINEDFLRKFFPKDWSILICTLSERQNSFERIYNKLLSQIRENHLEDKVEVLYFLDNRENSIGFKRDELMRRSKGLYTCFIDDDDDVSNDYIHLIYEQLKDRPDCTNLIGVITFNGENPRIFIHSIEYDHFFEKDQIYYRPPNHLNPIKRSIGSRFLFPDIYNGEDTDWALQIVDAGLLKIEGKITTPYYYYLYDSTKKENRRY